ncbi:MAG: rhodanese-like domain-containing protein [Oscillospiraceae bacterium]|nr:rhodanese-like domain-containing protein [Oscillospiraceae bacterium]
MRKKVDFAQARQLLDDLPDCVLIDVREEEEYITGHAVDALLLPVDEITAESAAELIPGRDTPVLVYCRSGYRSAMAAEKLEALGYTRLYDIGSLIGWPYGLV